MRVGAILGTSLAAVLGVAALFSACSGVTHDKPPGPPAPSAAASTPPSPSVAAPPPTPADAGVMDASGPAQVAAPRDCRDPQVAILNHPDGGVIFNNAMTSADAGFIDRGQLVIDALGQQAHALRCCFDPWVRAHSNEVGAMLLRLTLDGDGKVLTAEIDRGRSDIDDEPTRACIVGVARDAVYPPSPTAKETTVEYPFRVGALEP